MPKGQPQTTTIRVEENEITGGRKVGAVILPAQKIYCRDMAHALAAQQAICEAIDTYTMNESFATE